MRTIPSLTGLRGIAAVWVLLYHACTVSRAIGAGWVARVGILPAGWVGVDLFFVLSGFILMWNHGADFDLPTRRTVQRFAVSRILRVYPLNLAVLALIAVLVRSDHGFAAWYRALAPGNLSAMSFARTALLSTRWGSGDGGDWNQPVWSLSAEIVGYAAFPVIAWFMGRRTHLEAIALAMACFGLLAASEVLRGVQGNTIDQVSALTRMACCFTAGVAASRARQLVGESFPHAGEAALASAVLIGAACHFPMGFLLAPAGFGLLIFFLSFGTGSLERFLTSKPVMFLGKISFPLYLVHVMPLLWLGWRFHDAGLGPVAASLVVLAGVAACGVAGTVLHYAVERPSHRWARPWLRSASAGRPTASRRQSRCPRQGPAGDENLTGNRTIAKSNYR